MVEKTSGHHFWTELGLVAMVCIWGLNFVVVKWALAAFDPLAFNAIRHVLASTFMFCVLTVRGGVEKPARSDIPRIVFLGILGTIMYQMVFILGLDRTSAGNGSLMLATVPIFLLIFGKATERPLIAWIGAAFSISGVAMVTGSAVRFGGTEHLIGDLMLIGSAGIWAAYTIGSRPLIDRYGPIRSTAWALWVGSIGLFLIGVPALFAQDWSRVNPAAWGGVFFSAIMSIGIAYLLWYRGVQKLGGPKTGVFSNLTPVIALIAGAVWLDEPITVYSVMGAIMVIGGVLLVRSESLRNILPAALTRR